MFSLCYTVLHPEKVKNLITMVTPVDFTSKRACPILWAGCSTGGQTMDVDVLANALGNIPGEFMNFGFLMLKLFQLPARENTLKSSTSWITTKNCSTSSAWRNGSLIVPTRPARPIGSS